MTTTEETANGEAPKTETRRARTTIAAPPPEGELTSEFDRVREAMVQRREELLLELHALEDRLGIVKDAKVSEAKPPRATRASASKTATSKRPGAPRGPRAESMTAKALTFIATKNHPQTAAQLAKHLDVETTRASQIIFGLSKNKLVTKHGKRGSYTYGSA